MKKWQAKLYNPPTTRANHTLGQRRKRTYQFVPDIHHVHTSYLVRHHLRRRVRYLSTYQRHASQDPLTINKN